MRESGGGEAQILYAHSLSLLWFVFVFVFVSIYFLGAREVVCCSRLVNCWMLMKFNSLTLVNGLEICL